VSGAIFPVGNTPVTCVASDPSGNSTTNTFIVTVLDADPPTIGAVTATQNAADVKNTGTVLQGIVNVTVQASDQCGLPAAPTITLTNEAAVTESAVFVDESPAGTYNYTWTVLPTTANGNWTATVTASDGANTTTTSFSLFVNKRQITGQVELEAFVGAVREVSFVVTNDGSGISKAWTLPLTFSGGVASYTLTDVPDGVTRLAAWTAWNLRKIEPVALDLDGQDTVIFTGLELIRGGDIDQTDGMNWVNLLDYTVLEANWFTHNEVADITGDGNVDIDDYFILYLNWFTYGDNW